MKLFFHFAVNTFSNTYLLGPDSGGEAILIDPGKMNIDLLKTIEENDYYIKYILITHRHASHIQGIKTILKIYDAEIYSYHKQILEFPSHEIQHKQVFMLNDFKITAFAIPGHSSDSLVYLISHMLFTGDTLGAGRLGTTKDSYSKDIMLKAIQEHLFKLDNDMIIFPGHGPPSTIKLEKLYNKSLQDLI